MRISNRISELANTIGEYARDRDERTQELMARVKSTLRTLAADVAPLEVRLLTTPEEIEERHEHGGN